MSGSSSAAAAKVVDPHANAHSPEGLKAGEHACVIPSRKLEYLSGFGAEHASESLPGALPVGQNSPQICPYGLYAEQLSGTAFTVPRAKNQRSWLYRIKPSVVHSRFIRMEHAGLLGSFEKEIIDPNQLRWFPQPMPAADVEKDFVDGLRTMAGAGDAAAKSGIAVHVYACNASMEDTCMYNSDGDFLIVPQTGTLHIQTEFGFMDVEPKEVCVIQRGIRFRVAIDEPSRGYILELFNGHFQLPDLGPIGSNGLANPRDFLTPVAAYEDREVDYVVINKYGGQLFTALTTSSPFDVVAWHGNYAPYKYDLSKFNTMNSVSFDHPDPSIYTVLTCPSDTPGVAVCDFVIFPPRWMVMDHTFRPPWYHRNVMTEFMGMVWGKYDAKVGFQPGGSSLHSCMSSHGPDADTFLKASGADLKPDHFGAGLAFMFETCHLLKLTHWAMSCGHRDVDYQKCWQALPKVFDPTVRDVKALAVKETAAPGALGSAGAGVGTVYGDGSSVGRVAAPAHVLSALGAGAGAAPSDEVPMGGAAGAGAGGAGSAAGEGGGAGAGKRGGGSRARKAAMTAALAGGASSLAGADAGGKEAAAAAASPGSEEVGHKRKRVGSR